MSYDSRDVREARDEELSDWAHSHVPTLRQMHAIEELARRAVEAPALLPLAVGLVAEHLSPRVRMGGLPVGYLGALVLRRAGGEPWRALCEALAGVDPLDRQDVLRWVEPVL